MGSIKSKDYHKHRGCFTIRSLNPCSSICTAAAAAAQPRCTPSAKPPDDLMVDPADLSVAPSNSDHPPSSDPTSGPTRNPTISPRDHRADPSVAPNSSDLPLT